MSKIKKCKWCGNEYLQRDGFMQYCDYTCKWKHTEIKPSKINALEVKKKIITKVARVEDPELQRSRELITKAHLQKKWFITCGLCYCSGLQHHLHHIIYRSEAPKHKNLHNPKNLVYLCSHCHQEIHSYKKDYRAFRIVQRKLRELFEDVSMQHYLDYENYLNENDSNYKAFKCKSLPTRQAL